MGTAAAATIAAVAGSLSAVAQEGTGFLCQTLVGWPVAAFLLVSALGLTGHD